jgi:hypothetical protein
VFFNEQPSGPHLSISVFEHPVSGVQTSGLASQQGRPSVNYVLNRDAVPGPRQLKPWISEKIRREGVFNFQTALDSLTDSCARSEHYNLPHVSPIEF